MSRFTSGLAAPLVVATFALTSCGSDDGSATATAPAPGSTTVQTVTETATATEGTTTSTPRTTSTQTKTTTTPTTQSKTTTTAPSAAPQQASGRCGSVELGLRDGDVESTFARIDASGKIDCATAAYVVSQWGQQQLGFAKALLPRGWSCSRSNVCRNGRGSVSFVIKTPR